MTHLSLVFSFLAATTVFVLLYSLVFARMARGLGASISRRSAVILAIPLAAPPWILTTAIGRPPWISPLVYMGAIWLGVLTIALAFSIMEWMLSLVFPKRRRTITLCTLLAFPCLSGYALFNGSRLPLVKDIIITTEKMPSATSKFTLVQLSDLHLGHVTSLGRLRWIVERVNGLSADLVVITGDLADLDIGRDDEICQSLKQISARLGVVAVPGNHDYEAGIDRFLTLAGRANMTVLRNKQLVLDGVIQIVGLDEAAGRSSAEGGPDMAKALAGCDANKPIVLLRHQPFGFEEAARKDVDLQLSGHTHAGQIPPIDLLTWLTSPYAFGYYEKGRTRLYTSCGTGTWGPPMRLFSRNEIVKFTLVRK